MELEKDILTALLSYLQEHGYPPEVFAIEFPIGKKGKYRADLAILNLDSKEPIALFEIKQQRTSETEALGRRQLQSFLSTLEVKTIPIYLVFGKQGTPPFEIIRVSPEDQKTKSQVETAPVEIPGFEILTYNERNQAFHVKKNTRKKQVDRFFTVSMILASFVLALLIADLSGRLSISAIQVILMFLFIGLVLIPWASRIKFAGIEFERLKKEERPKKS